MKIYVIPFLLIFVIIFSINKNIRQDVYYIIIYHEPITNYIIMWIYLVVFSTYTYIVNK